MAVRVESLSWPAPQVLYQLPLQPKPIIGREQELAVARARLVRADVRLLTLTGPPGVGKTRLALELAHATLDQFGDGACFVDLAPVADARLVIEAIAHGLGLRDLDRRIAVELVEEFLREKSLLLILDNFEQVLDAADVVDRLLTACARLKVIATSRAPLHLGWERELPVPPLELPPRAAEQRAEAVATSAAGHLFVERAQAVAPEFILNDADAAAVAEVCAHLDGLPLAIELAAARIKLFPPRALLRRLAQSPLRLLAGQTRDLPPRHQTLLGAITWSYDLLGADEQRLLRRLSVFTDGCSLEAAEAVGAHEVADGLDVVASLLDKSLLWQEEQPDGEPRLRMLETIHEFAREHLEASNEAAAVHARHAEYYVSIVEQGGPQLVGREQQLWFARLERERANLLAVEHWAAVRGDRETVVRLGAALWPFWLAREDPSHARDRLEAIVPLVGQVQASPKLVRALQGAGLMAEKLGEYATCRWLLEQGVALARQIEDRASLASVLDSLGRQRFIEGQYAESRPLLEESHTILCDLDDRVGLARVLSHLGFLEFLEGRPAAAREIFERGLSLAQAAGDQHRVAEFMDNLGNTAEVEGKDEDAAQAFEQAIAIWRRLGQGHWLAMALNNLGKLELRRGELDLAREHLLEALSLAHRMGNRRRLAYTLSAVAALATAEGESVRAANLQAVAAATIAEIGAAFPPRNRRGMADSTLAASTPTMTLAEAVEDSLGWLKVAQPRSMLSHDDKVGGLTRREREVVSLVALGLTNRQIAEALVLTEGTAENYVQRILRKLGFNNRAQIAAWATEQNLRPN